MNKTAFVLLVLFAVAVPLATGCQTTRRAIYACPGCGSVVSPDATVCPICNKRLMPLGVARPAPVPTTGSTQGTVQFPTAQAPRRVEEPKALPVKVGALFEVTDSNHRRFTPFVSAEIFKIERAKDRPIITFDIGVADQAIFAAAGIRGVARKAPDVGFFIFVMSDFRPTHKYRGAIHKTKPHLCTGFGISIGGF